MEIMSEERPFRGGMDNFFHITMNREDRKNAMALGTIERMAAFLEQRKPAFSGR